MKNKKLFICIIVIVLIAIGILVFLLSNKEPNDNKKFEKEYNVIVPKYTKVIYLTEDTIIKALETQDKLVFFGNKDEKTKQAVSVLLKTAEEKVVDKIYYYDTSNIKDKDISKKLLEKLNKKEIVTPSLFLLKDKKIDSIEEGINEETKEKYKKIMVAYLMCTSENC